MNIHIRGNRTASTYLPVVPTLALQIFDSYPGSPKTTLRDSPLFTICSYTFDDIDSDQLLEHYPQTDVNKLVERHVLFNKPLAQEILNDFTTKRVNNLDLLIHCTLGASRSPAVAIALNEIFNLGQQNLKEQYPAYNHFVYRLLKETI